MKNNQSKGDPRQVEIATLGGGCFWCTEAVFSRIQGVLKVVSGYSGGNVANPTYKQVTRGRTGHAEVVQITFDPSIISFQEILEIFFETHDPTTLNRQGNDIGTQYRSVIFYHNADQKQVAEQLIADLEDANVYDKPIVTQTEPFTSFYEAEDYHRDYYRQNPQQGYSRFVIAPKLVKLHSKFSKKLKKQMKG